MLKLIFGFIALALIAGTIARMFVPKEQRPPRPKLRPLVSRIAIILVLVSAAAVATHWYFNWPASTSTSASASAPKTAGIAFKGTDLAGADVGGDFALIDHSGQSRTLKSFRGKAVVIFFGYTQCPDVCPSALAKFKETLSLLGTEAGKVQVLFITVDPERDTQAVLANYVPWFHPAFLGLYGKPEDTQAVTKAFRVFYAKRDNKGALAYTVDHTAGAFVLDPAGRTRLFVPPEMAAADLAGDLRNLLAER